MADLQTVDTDPYDPPEDAPPIAQPGELQDAAPPPARAPSQFTRPGDPERLAAGAAVAGKTAPDRAARIFRLQLKTGLPSEVIDRNLDDVERQAAAQGFSAENLRRDSPAVAAWLSSDAYRAALAQDDLDHLSALERTLNVGRNLAGAAGAGVMDFSQGAYGLVQAGADAIGAHALAESAGGSAAVAGRLAARLRGPQAGAGFVQRAVLSGVEGAGQMVPALVAGAVAGPAALLGVVGASGGGQGYTQARAQGASVERSLGYGGIDSAIQVATFFVPAHLLIGDLVAHAPFITTVAHQLVSTVPAQEVATALQDLNAWAFLPENANRTFGDYLKERPSAAAASAIAAITAVGATTAAAHGTAQVLGRIGDAAQASTTITRAPEQVRALVESATTGTPIATVHLPIDSFTTYWQSKGVDPVAVAARLTGEPDAYAQARQTGADLAVPMGRYVTDIAASPEHGPFFQREARFNPEALNVREAQALDAEIGRQMAAAPPETPHPAAPVGEAVRSQLTAAGESPSNAAVQATLVEHAFGTLGERAEIDPVALFERYGLRVRREGVTPLEEPGADVVAFNQSLRSQLADAEAKLQGLSAQGTLEGSRAVPFPTIDARTADTLYQAADRSQERRITVPLDQLVSTQDTISEPIAREKLTSDQPLPRVLEYDGRYYLGDGTHTAAAAWARGEKTIDVLASPVDAARLRPTVLSQGERGRITFGADRQFNIDLLKGADLSTFVHESSHLYLEALGDVVDTLGTRDAATLTESQRGLLADHKTLLDWLGVASRADIGTQQHEQFARGFEAYLREGKAPSPELRPVFARVRAWLVSLYRSARDLHVELTPDVRGVMDRLLASDDAIAAAARDQHVRPLLTPATADALGLSAEERRAYQATVDGASAKAQDTLQAELAAQGAREQTDWWQQELAAVRTEVAGAIEAQPTYRARALLEDGTRPDGSPLPAGVEPFKLSRAALVEQFGEGVLRRLPANVSVEGDGVPPAVAADMLGFRSATALVQALVQTPPLQDAIAAAADAQMRERHGDLLVDGSLADRAQAAVMDAGSEMFAAELHALSSAAAKRGSRVTTPPVSTIREIAERRIAETAVGDVRPGVFAAAARRAGDAALEAAGRQDFAAALAAKQKQVLNAELFRAATGARTMVEQTIDAIKPMFARDATLAPRYDVDMVNAARSLLADFHLASRGQGEAAAAYLEKVRRYDPETYQDLDAAVAATALPPRSYRELTVSEFTALRDAIDNLWHVARRSRQMVINGQLRELADVRQQVLAQVDQFQTPQERPGYTRAVSTWDRVHVALLGLRARARRIEHWVTAVDNGREGPARSAIFDPVNDGAVRYDAARTEVAQHYQADVVARLQGSPRATEIEAPELGYTFKDKHVELLGALLHTGNGFEPGSNGYKLLRGRGWGELHEDGSVDTSRWDTFVVRMVRDGVLTAQDYDHVQRVWDLNESLKADAQRTHKARYGRYFDEVTKVGFDTPFGHYAGGYYPAVPDPFITPSAGDRAQTAALLEGGATGSTMFPSVNRGFTRTRELTYAKPLILDATQVLAHLNAVLRFTYLSQPVSDVARLVLHPSFRDRLDAVDAAAVSDLIKPYLDRAASQQMFVPAQGKAGRAIDTVAREIRTRGALQLVAVNATVLAEQFTHLPSVLAHSDIDATKLLAGVWRLSRGPQALAEAVREASPFMRTRESAGLMEAHAAIDRILLDPNPAQRASQYVRDHATVLMRGIQSGMDLATWQAVYDKVAAEPEMTHDRAVLRADAAVREALGSYRPQDRAAFEGGSQLVGLLNQFYGFFGTKLNVLGTEAVLASRLGLQRRFSRGLAIYAFGLMIPAMLGEGIKNAMHGRGFLGTGEDDDTDAATAVLRFWGESQEHMLARMVPFGGPAADMLMRSFGTGRSGQILNVPGITMVEDAIHAPGEAYRAVFHEDATPAQKKKALTDMFTLLGMLSGQPLRPVGQAINVAADAADGQ